MMVASALQEPVKCVQWTNGLCILLQNCFSTAGPLLMFHLAHHAAMMVASALQDTVPVFDEPKVILDLAAKSAPCLCLH